MFAHTQLDFCIPEECIGFTGYVLYELRNKNPSRVCLLPAMRNEKVLIFRSSTRLFCPSKIPDTGLQDAKRFDTIHYLCGSPSHSIAAHRVQFDLMTRVNLGG